MGDDATTCCDRRQLAELPTQSTNSLNNGRLCLQNQARNAYMPPDEKIADMTWFKVRSATAAPDKGRSRPRLGLVTG